MPTCSPDPDIAHLIKGSASQIGAVEIARLAGDIESHYLDENSGSPGVTVTQLEATRSRLDSTIGAYR